MSTNVLERVAERISGHCGGFTKEYSLDCAEGVLEILQEELEAELNRRYPYSGFLRQGWEEVIDYIGSNP